MTEQHDPSKVHPLLDAELRRMGWIPAREAGPFVLEARELTDADRDAFIRAWRGPRAWILWDGLAGRAAAQWPIVACPVPPGTLVVVRFRDGETLATEQPEQMRWAWTRPYKANADIVAFRVL